MKDDKLLPITNAFADGDYELPLKKDMAKDLYMKGHNIDEVAKRTELRPWTIRNWALKGEDGEKPWLEQRREARVEFVAECQELTKVSLSKAYRTLGDALFAIMTDAIRKNEEGAYKPYEQIKLMDTIIRGIKEVHSIFMPAMKTPLVNIALQNNPKMNEAQIVEQLIDWGLEASEEDRKDA